MAKTDKGLTVKQAIEYLTKLEDKEMVILIDCPFCGRGQQLAKIVEVVVISGHEDNE